MNDLNSLVRTVTAEAYELADKRGRLPERIEVKASFDMDYSGRLTLNQSRRFPNHISKTVLSTVKIGPPTRRKSMRFVWRVSPLPVR